MWIISLFLNKLKTVLFLQFHITLPFNYLVILLLGNVLITYFFLKARVFSNYSQLKDNEVDDNARSRKKFIGESTASYLINHEQKKGFTSYLDEFLSAIKIFGYLEKPVFHELTKSMKTEKLEAGEIVLLDDSVGFTIVVEGQLQILHKVDSSRPNIDTGLRSSFFDPLSDDGYIINGERFQLLNVIKAGNPLSSLVSILKLFTNKTASKERRSADSNSLNNKTRTRSPSLNGNIHSFLDSTLPSKLQNRNGDPSNSPIEYEDDLESMANRSEQHCSLPEIIARASSDCTIAIIPSSSFQRLLVKYPRSASHIIQMILTKLYRVTFQTAHKYLGLANEIILTELHSIDSELSKLPEYSRRSIIDSFLSQNSQKSVINASNVGIKSTNTKAPPKPKLNSLNSSTSINYSSRHVVLNSRDKFNPGDLLSSVPLTRLSTDLCMSKSTSSSTLPLEELKTTSHTRNFSSANFEETEESSWRLALIEIIFKQLCITSDSMQLPIPDDSHATDTSIEENDPMRRLSYSSVTSVSSSMNSSPNNTLITFLPQEIQSRTLSKSNKKTQKISKNSKDRNIEKCDNDLQLSDFDSIKEEFSKCIKISKFEKGETIVHQDSNPQGIFYIVSGEIDVISEAKKNANNGSSKKTLYTIGEGHIIGYLSSMLGCNSLMTLTASSEEVYVALIPFADIERLCDKYFMIYLRLSETLTNSISSNLLKLDYFLEWIHLESSETLFNQGDPANAIYLVLNGRLRQIFYESECSDNVNYVNELSKGESFGEVEVLTAINRLNTVVAIRDSELARIPRTLFEFLALEHPSTVIHVSRIVAKKAMNMDGRSGIMINGLTSIDKTISLKNDNDLKCDLNLKIRSNKFLQPNKCYWNTNVNYKTITVLPVTEGLPVEEFALKLICAFRQCEKTTVGLNQRTALSHLGRHAFDKLSKLKQSGYFAELEELNDIVVYIGDTSVTSSWTQTCISQGDCILLLADACAEPDIGEFERLLLKSKTTARTDLILLHPERYVIPGSTAKWLKNRISIHTHHHIQFVVKEKMSQQDTLPNNRTFQMLMRRLRENTKKTQENFVKLLPASIKTTVESLSGKSLGAKRGSGIYTPVDPIKSDFLRLARILSGQAVGLVLGGGGARGLSHLGILKAIEEKGIPIDVVGGTSIGSFIGGLYAKEYDLVPIYGRAKKFAGRVSSLWRMLSDLTWPVTSYTTGHEFNRGVWKSFGDYKIEDFWVSYYCNTTNITESAQEIHTSGFAWRYIRASMSLAGLLPPIIDNGNMLLDGGYVDNLPVTEMKQRGCKVIFAVDVGSVDDKTPMTYGDSLNGFWIIFNRWNPFSKHPNIPNMAEIQMRLGYVASVNALERAKNTPGVLYIRPPIENYATLDFAKFEEIYQVGVAYGNDFLQHLQETGNLPKIPGTSNLHSKDKNVMLQRRNSI